MSISTWVRQGVSSTWFRLILGLGLTALSLYLAIRQVNLYEVGDVLGRADVPFVLLALGSVLLNNIAKAFRWHVLLGARRRSVSTLRAFNVLLMGQAINALLPLRLGEILRAYIVGGMGLGRSFTAGTIVLEKVLDMLCYALLFFCSSSRSLSRSGPANLPIPS